MARPRLLSPLRRQEGGPGVEFWAETLALCYDPLRRPREVGAIIPSYGGGRR